MATLQEKLKNLNKLSADLNKKAGKFVMGSSDNEELKKSLDISFISTPSLRLNKALGGGWPKGRFTIVTGKEDSGKTFELLESIANEQKKDPNFVGGWLETEHSVTNQDIDMFGIDRSRFFYLSFDVSDGGAEAVIDRVFAALTCGIDMFVINSLKNLIPSDELNNSMEKQSIGLQARMNSKFVRKLKPILADTNTAFIGVQHLSTEIGKMFGDPLTMSGGTALRYGADLICDFRKLSIQAGEPITRDEGIKIKVSVIKNHIITDKNPYVSAEYYGIFGQGTEKYLEAIDLAVEQGYVQKRGAFFKIPDEEGNPLVINGQKMQWQGLTSFRQYCKDNPDFYEDLVSKLDIQVESLSEEEIEKAKELEANDLKNAQEILNEASKK